MKMGMKWTLNSQRIGSSFCCAVETNPNSIHEDVGSIRGFTQWGWESGFAMSCGIGHRRGLDPMLLWLWHRPAAVTVI